MKNFKFVVKNYYFLVSFILLLSFSRLIPHPPNFTPILAAAIFSGFCFRNFYLSTLIVILSIFLSDIILGFHNQTIFIYMALMVSVLLGLSIKNFKFIQILYTGLAASICFFIITNFGAWIFLDIYEKNLSGLINCYIMGIPFFKNTLSSTIFYLLLIKVVFGFLANRKFKNNLNFFNIR